MPARIATAVYIVTIIGLFWLDRDRRKRASAGLWVAVLWLWMACSRSVGQWIAGAQATASMTSADQYAGEGNSLDRGVYLGLIVVGLLVLLGRRRNLWRVLRGSEVIILFFLYCAVSLVWSDYPDIAFKRWTKAIGDFVMVLIVWTDPEPVAAVKRLLARSAYVLIPLSVLFIKYYPELGRGYGLWDWKTYYTGVTTNKNTLGVTCLLFGLGCAWRFITSYRNRAEPGRARRLIASGAVLAMTIWLFWVADSMSSLASFLVATGLLMITSTRAVARRPALVHIAVAAELALCIGILFFGMGAGLIRNTMQRDTATLTDRTQVWQLVLSQVSDPILGAGFESFWLGPRLQVMWSAYSWHPNQAHNGYLEVFANLGWVGVTLLAVVILAGYRKVLAVYRSDPMVGNLTLAYFVVGLVYNCTEAAFFRMMAPAWIFFLLAITKAPMDMRPTRAVILSTGATSNRTPSWSIT